MSPCQCCHRLSAQWQGCRVLVPWMLPLCICREAQKDHHCHWCQNLLWCWSSLWWIYRSVSLPIPYYYVCPATWVIFFFSFRPHQTYFFSKWIWYLLQFADFTAELPNLVILFSCSIFLPQIQMSMWEVWYVFYLSLVGYIKDRILGSLELSNSTNKVLEWHNLLWTMPILVGLLDIQFDMKTVNKGPTEGIYGVLYVVYKLIVL